MLFVSDSILDAKDKLTQELARKPSDGLRIFAKILDLDPDDHIAMVLLANLKAEAGDRSTAEELLWRAVHAQPCSWAPYQQLAHLLIEEKPLADGLLELWCRKILRDEEGLERLEKSGPGFDWKDDPGHEDLTTRERFEGLAYTLRGRRDLEPLAVTSRLRPLRLIDQLQEGDSLEPSFVDALLEQKPIIVPLIVGVLRGWTSDVLPEDAVTVVENSLAILGEIGDASVIPHLLQLANMEDPEIAGPCGWALDHIVDRHPEEAAQIMEKIAPDLDAGERIAVAERLVTRPNLNPSGTILQRLFEKLDDVDKEARDTCFQIMLSVALVRGPRRVEIARSLLRRHGSLISRAARRSCEDLIEELGAVPPPPPHAPEPSPWSVYQICNKEVDWEAEMKSGDEEESEEDDYYPPEQLRRKSAPERNDPCWCGSGKKYKKCHLEADERKNRESSQVDADDAEEPLEGLDKVRRRVGEMLHKEVPLKESRIAAEEFFGSEQPDPDSAMMAFSDWMVHDRVSDKFGRTVMEEFLARHELELSLDEQNFLEASIASYVDLYEVQEVAEGKGLEVKSLTSGQASFVHDVSLSRKMVRWDGFLSRVVADERGLAFTGLGLTVPRMHLQKFLAWLEENRRRTGLSWPLFMKRNWPRTRAHVMEIANEWMSSLRLSNTDGEEMVLSKALHKVVNRGALIASLRSAVDIDETEEGTSFTWLNGPAGETGLTVLGTIRVVGAGLTLECNSRERLKRGKKLLVELAGTALTFQKDEFTTQEEFKREIREKPSGAESAADEIPLELQLKIASEYMEKHYAEWPDTRLPALDGKTPRQAVKNAAGKRKVAQLLKDFENTEARKRKAGEYAFDFSRLRAELGIKG